MSLLTFTDWPIIKGSFQVSGLFYIFQIIRSYLQSKNNEDEGIGIHLYTIYNYVILYALG